MTVSLKPKTIRKILIKKNKSQNWLAKRLKISSCYMSQLMNGYRNPSGKLRENIMKILPDCTFEELFTINGE